MRSLDFHHLNPRAECTRGDVDCLLRRPPVEAEELHPRRPLLQVGSPTPIVFLNERGEPEVLWDFEVHGQGFDQVGTQCGGVSLQGTL